MQAATFFKRVVSVSTGLCSPAVQLVLPSTAVISSRSAFQPGCCVCSHKSLWQSMSHVEQQEQHQHTTPPGVNPFILPYTPAPYSASPAASTGDLPAGSTVTRKDQLEFVLTKLRAEVDSLDTDGWMFEAPRHRQR